MTWETYRKEIEAKGTLPEDWYILGIDLGTTHSVISYWDNTNRRPEPIDISNGFGKIPLPSVVQFRDGEGDDGDEWVIGEEAYRSMKMYPETTVRSIKRKMGTNSTVRLGGVDYLSEEISAKILKELTDHAQNLNPKAEIAGLVVSVPYDFDDAAQKATMRACEMAGLADKLICLIKEPNAAALAYNFRNNLKKDEKIMVFDFGGGTLDITLFHVAERDDARIKLAVISQGGEATHGGDDVDATLVEACAQFIHVKTGQALHELAIENQVELVARAREAKERLSGVQRFRIPFTFCIPPFVEQITREDFHKLIDPFINKTRKLVLKALRETYTGSLTPDDIDRVLLEGGSSQMPWVREMLLDIFSDENKIYSSERPALDISLGATYYAAMKMGLLASPDMESEKVTVDFEVTVPHDIGLEIDNGTEKKFFAMIRRGTFYALAKKSHVFTLSGTAPDDMTGLALKILERVQADDPYENCKVIGEVAISGLPERPSGKTKLKITLMVEEEGGLVRGQVEDMGFGSDWPSSGFKENFAPERFVKTELSGGQ
ncbi:MAG: Hsp70 family protein [Defluviitaleaceae bacterium]|nr:Hsp70 family protein [Defluviitaleaceae bacterium]MCL2276033.1 Hsp70 family protein [Defluviitaleaceae bacterium]